MIWGAVLVIGFIIMGMRTGRRGAAIQRWAVLLAFGVLVVMGLELHAI